MGKPEFDPKKPFQKPEFNPDKPFLVAGKGGGDQVDQGALQTALESYGNAASFGYLPQLQAATYPAFEKVGEIITGKDLPKETYTERRDVNIRRQKAQQEENPAAAMAGTIGGAVASPLLLGKALSLAKVPAALNPAQATAKTVFPTMGRGGASIGKIAEMAAKGGATAALMNPGDTEGETAGLQIPERLENAKTGAILGGAVQGGGEIASKALGATRNLPEGLKKFAERRAFGAAGADKRAFIQQFGKGRVEKIGRILLDEGVITPGASLDDIAEKALELRGKSSGLIGDILKSTKAVDDLNWKDINPKVREEILDRTIRTDIGSKLRSRLIQDSEIPGVAHENSVYEQLIHDFERGQKKLDVEYLQDLKNKLGGTKGNPGLIKWDRLPGADIPPKEEFYRALYSEVNDAIESWVKAVSPKQFDKLTEAKAIMGATAESAKMAQKRLAGMQANQQFGLGDKMMAGAGAVAAAGKGADFAGTTLTGLGAGLVNKLVRTYGNQTAAVLSDAASKRLAHGFGGMGKYSKPLEAALKQGQPAFMAQVLKFAKDPEFIEQIKDELPQPEEKKAEEGSAIKRRMIIKGN